MRRVMVIVLTVLLAGSLSVGATADSLRVRTDPNDVPGHLDIRTVTSDLSTSQVYLRIGSWNRFRQHEYYYIVVLDTTGTRESDRLVEFVSGKCYVYDSRSEELLGTRPVSRTRKSVACTLPRLWFPDIQRAVRFYVKTYFRSGHASERAPDEGRYHWL